MTNPRNELDPTKIVLNLMRLSARIQELADELDRVEEEAVNAREDYTRDYAKAFLDSEGPMDVRKQKSLWSTSAIRVAAELAETRVRGLKRQIDTLKTRVEIGRSTAALVRAESELLNVRGRG